jgi:hypothetical protein
VRGTPELILKEIAQNGTGKRNLFALSVLSNVKREIISVPDANINPQGSG